MGNSGNVSQTGEKTDVAKWSDPQIALQVDRFRRVVGAYVDAQPSGTEALQAAEELCEWSRNLLNRTFGRTTPRDLMQLSEVFADTAAKVRLWIPRLSDEHSATQLKAFAKHIEERTHHIQERMPVLSS